jgi:hypothetical protein
MRTLTFLFLCSCLGPQVSDEPGASLNVLPPRTTVPYVSNNADLSRQIRVNDGLSDSALATSGGVVPLKSGFAATLPLQYWDLGDAPDSGSLLYRLVRREAEDTFTPIDHPMIADALPGDPGYSPFHYVQHVVVTAAYAGEVLPSLEALADAVELGLVEEPIPALLFVDGPIVPRETKLARGADVPPQEAVVVFARGYQVDMLLVGGIVPLARAGRLPKADVHRVWVGTAINPMGEPTFQHGATPFTPAVRVIESRVADPADPMDPAAKIDDEGELFIRDPMGNLSAATPRVMSWVLTTSIKNWPVFVPEVTP